MKTVLLTVDALRADHLSQYGYDRDTMPVVDRILRDGTQFEAAFANGTNTGVSLPSLLASRYFGADGARNGPNVATVLAEGGVTTAGFHSNTLFANRVDTVAGFDHYEDFNVADSTGETEDAIHERVYRAFVDTLRPVVERLGVRNYAERMQEFVFPTSLIHDFTVYVDAERLTEEVLSWVEDHTDEDFFLWIHYMDPHRPYGIDVADPEYGALADRDEIRSLMSKAGIRPDEVTPAERERIIDLYDSDVRYTSEHISCLVDGFEELDIWGETGLVFTADHGEEFGDHGYYYHRNRPYDELIHVPLVIKPPESSEGSPVTDQRELLDVAPTICDWHGVASDAGFQGRHLFGGGSREVVATGSFVEDGPVVAGRWDGWKYIHVDGVGTELYWLSDDPEEIVEVSDDNPDIVDDFERSIPDAVYQGESVSVYAADEVVRERLSELGYVS